LAGAAALFGEARFIGVGGSPVAAQRYHIAGAFAARHQSFICGFDAVRIPALNSC
jgi:hypothetical protein